MLDSVLFARDKWLKEDGLMFPNRATMHIAALDDGIYYKKKLVKICLNLDFLGQCLWSVDEMHKKMGPFIAHYRPDLKA